MHINPNLTGYFFIFKLNVQTANVRKKSEIATLLTLFVSIKNKQNNNMLLKFKLYSDELINDC